MANTAKKSTLTAVKSAKNSEKQSKNTGRKGAKANNKNVKVDPPEVEVRPIKLKNPEDVRKLLVNIINQLRKGEIAEGRARTLVYSASALLNVIQNVDFDAKIKELQELAKKLEMKSTRRR
jgi:uncharacterized protein YpuA (DUF1002 family)